MNEVKFGIIYSSRDMVIRDILGRIVEWDPVTTGIYCSECSEGLFNANAPAALDDVVVDKDHQLACVMCKRLLSKG